MSKKLSLMKLSYLVIILSSYFLIGPSGLGRLEVGVADVTSSAIDLQTFSTHSRLSFRLDPGVGAEWKGHSKGFDLVFKGIGLVDLGVPFGNEENWLKRFRGLSDSRLQSIELSETTEGLIVKGRWKFPKGDSAPAYPEMEKFDFRIKAPPQYVIDFWLKDGPTVAQVRKQKEVERKLAALKAAQEKAKARAIRRAARKKLEVKGANVVEFCKEPLKKGRNVFLKFQPVHRDVDFRQWFTDNVPDRNYRYLVPKGSSKEARYARLALRLYENGKYGLVNRTIDFLKKEVPKSNLINEMRFLRANSLIRLGLQEQAFRILKELTIYATESPVSIHAGEFLAAKAFYEKNYLLALESFFGLSRHHPDHRLKWVFHLGAAESLYKLRQVDRALVEYNWIQEYAPRPVDRSIAGLRIGDVYMYRGQYAQALAAYYKALNQFSQFAKKFPEIYLNRGEALYWLGQYDRAEKEYRYYLEHFPTDRNGWRATFRLGEIFARRTGEDNIDESRKWFYQTVNHYPFSEGADLARLRLIPCGDHAGMDYASIEKFVEDAKKFDGKEVHMEEYRDFLYLNYVRYLLLKKYGERAAEVLAEALKSGFTLQTRVTLGASFKAIFRQHIDKLIAEGKKFEVLAYYERYAGRIPEVGDPLVPDVYLKVARISADLGLTDKAKNLIETYKKEDKRVSNRLLATERDEESLDLQLKKSRENFTEAKAAWIEFRNQAKKDGKVLEKIKEQLQSVVDESPFSYLRELILSMIELEQGNLQKALSRGVNAQILMKKYGGTIDLQIDYWVAILQGRAKRFQASIEKLAQLEKLVAEIPEKKNQKKAQDKAFSTSVAVGVPVLPGRTGLIFEQAQAYEALGKWGLAATTYERAIESGLVNNRTKYAYVRALGKIGGSENKTRAKKILTEISESEENDFWKVLAQEALANP